VRIVRRRRTLRGRWKITTTYLITSLTPFQAGPALLARWVRAAAKSSRDLVGEERAVRVAGVVAQGLGDVRDPGQS